MVNIPKQKLGKNGPAIDQLGFGLMGLSAFYGKPKPDAERFAVLDKAYELNERFWDTADLYGDNEDLIGAWFKNNPGKRENIFLATKFAGRVSDQGQMYFDSSPEYALQAIDKSLKRLGLPYVDLYYCHRIQHEIPIEKTVRAMAEIKKAGKAKYLGLSECSPDSLRRACAIEHIDAVQIEYSPFSLEIESTQIPLLKTCRELGVAVVAYSPIGRGLLSGALRSPKDLPEGDFRAMMPRFSDENFPRNLELVDKISEMAKRKNATATQLTLAWLMQQGPDIFPIPGTTNIERLESNVKAAEVKFTTEEEREFRQAVDKAEVAGTRYPEAMFSSLYVSTVPEK